MGYITGQWGIEIIDMTAVPSLIHLKDVQVYTPERVIDHGSVLVQDGWISSIGSMDELACPSGVKSIDAGGLVLAPGFIDLQINGAFGLDFTTQPEIIWQVGERLLQFGVTSFLPTIISSPPEIIRLAQEVIKAGPPPGYRGARILGLHLEGPFLNPVSCGAHDPRYLILPRPDLYRDWSPATGVCMVTLAPELPGALEAIQTLVRNGVLVSAGHSRADFEQADAGFAAGIRYATHLFNAMPPLDHHQPGLAGAVLSDQCMTAGLIVDGIHLHPSIVALVWKAMGPQRFNLVTDASPAMGMPPGEYQLAGRPVHVDINSARLHDGQLAGSLLSLDQALRNLMEFTACSLLDALPSVTWTPARLLGMDTSIGRLNPGCHADFVLLTPDHHIAAVWIGGLQVVSSSK